MPNPKESYLAMTGQFWLTLEAMVLVIQGEYGSVVVRCVLQWFKDQYSLNIARNRSHYETAPIGNALNDGMPLSERAPARPRIGCYARSAKMKLKSGESVS